MQKLSASAPAPPGSSVAAVLRLIRDEQAVTRADLMASTGLGRTAIAHRVDALLASHWIYEAGEAASTGGRPPSTLAFNERRGVVLVADLGATHCRIAVTDMCGRLLASRFRDADIELGPQRVLARVEEDFDALLAEVGEPPERVRGIGMGLPGPVEFATGTAVNPPIMPGWDGYSVPDHFSHRGVPVLVDNDVNIMALGEQRRVWPDTPHLLFVKVGTGIGCGIITGGLVHRGAQGAAGDIGHIRLNGHDDVVCRCGNVACVEAVASGGAMARQLADTHGTVNARDVVALVTSGDAEAGRLVRESGRLIGQVLAGVVNVFNPSAIVIGGDIAEIHQPLLAGVREAIYQRSLPLATRHLQLVQSALGDEAGIVGAAAMVIDRLLMDDAIEASIHEDPAGTATGLEGHRTTTSTVSS